MIIMDINTYEIAKCNLLTLSLQTLFIYLQIKIIIYSRTEMFSNVQTTSHSILSNSIFEK